MAAMSSGKSVVTKEGHLKLKEELEELKKRRPEIAQKIRAAREQGDLSENAAYKSAREEQSFIEGRIEELEEILKQAKVVEHEGGCEKIGVGCRVKAHSADQTQEFHLVGVLEADPGRGKISCESPLGRKLVGKRVGDKIVIKAPAGKLVYTIEEVD